MKHAWIGMMSLLLMIPLGGACAEGESTGERIKENAHEVGRVIEQGAVKAGRVIKKGAVEVGHAAEKGAEAVGDGVKKTAAKAKRNVAVARCNDGEYSYTTRNTCSDHGGVKERLRD
jgi:uncharacterized protein DUF3761